MDTYEKKYKEALERASNLHKDAVEMENNMTTKTCEVIFPELAESKDERISREITEFLVDFNNGEYEMPNENTTDSWLSWQQKQGKSDDIIAERARTEKQRVLVTESDGVANIDWDTRSIQDVKLLLEYGLDYIKKLEKQSDKAQKGGINYDKSREIY